MTPNRLRLPRSTDSAVTLRSYRRSDKPALFRMLCFIDSRYPDGFAWLDRRLDDVADDRALCTVAVARGELVGVTIETPKGRNMIKLSTLWVEPRVARNRDWQQTSN